MEIESYIALFFGLVGTTLGLVNLYRDIKKSRVSVVVKPYPAITVLKGRSPILNLIPSVDELRRAYGTEHGPDRVVIQLTNSGDLPLYIVAVGFFNPKTPHSGRFYLITKKKGKSNIERLNPKEQRNIDTELTHKLKNHLKSGFSTAFVELGGGEITAGSTLVFNAFIGNLKNSP